MQTRRELFRRLGGAMVGLKSVAAIAETADLGPGYDWHLDPNVGTELSGDMPGYGRVVIQRPASGWIMPTDWNFVETQEWVQYVKSTPFKEPRP